MGKQPIVLIPEDELVASITKVLNTNDLHRGPVVPHLRIGGNPVLLPDYLLAQPEGVE